MNISETCLTTLQEAVPSWLATNQVSDDWEDL